MMSRTLVTGSSGFMASWLVEALRDGGHDVFGTDSMVGGRNQTAGVPTLVGDLSDHAFARHVADAVRPRVLVHMAADPREGASWYRIDSVTRNNLGAYCSILEACLRHGLDKIIVFSSMSIYGDQKPPFTEGMLASPVDPYGVNKAAMEAVTWQLAPLFGFVPVVVRPHNVIGPRQFVDPIRNVAMIFINSALRGEPIRVFGHGCQVRAFSNIRDSLPCYVRAIETPAADYRTVNIGGEQPIAVRELAEFVADLVPGSEIVYEPPRYGEVHDAFCDHELAKSLLGFEEKHGWRAAVQEMVAWAEENGPWDWEPVLVNTPTMYTPAHWKVEL